MSMNASNQAWLVMRLAFAAIGAVVLLATPTVAQEPDLSDLSPQQRRAVERMLGQGTELSAVEAPQAGALRPAEAIPANGRLLTPPAFARRQSGGDIVAVNIAPTGAGGVTSDLVTFGQAFRPGDVPRGSGLALRVGSALYPVQVDVKATHTDGSVRHAVLTADLSGLSGLSGRGHQGMLVRAAPMAGRILGDDFPENVTVSLDGERADRTPFSATIDVTGLEGQAVWLDGPLVREVSAAQDIGPLLTLRVDRRAHADGSVRLRLTFENHKTFTPGSRDMSYRVTIRTGNRVLRDIGPVAHYRGSNWSEVITTGAAPGWRVARDPAYLAVSGAVLPFDLRYGVAETVIAADLAALAQEAGPLSPGLLTPYMPSSGGRAEIGPLPAWDVFWLKSQDARAEALMLQMAARGGAVPWHFEDEATGAPVRVDRHPLFWADPEGMAEWRGADRLPAGYFMGRDGGWTLDTAHRPLMSYTAYLATGDAYYARELAHEAAFAIAKIWPDLRAGKEGMGEAWVAEELQLRGRAWALRDVGAAAWLLPDDAPLKDYFRTARDMSIAYMANKYIDRGALDAAGETEGWFEDTSYSVEGGVPPWQNDYMVITLAHEALRGSVDAARLVQWAENYQAGRFLSTGASPALGAAYVHMLNAPGTQQPVGSWAAMLAETAGNEAYTENYPDYGAGYVASAYAALTLSHRVTGSDRALAAVEALASTQGDSALFDPRNRTSIHALPQFLMAYPDTD